MQTFYTFIDGMYAHTIGPVLGKLGIDLFRKEGANVEKSAHSVIALPPYSETLEKEEAAEKNQPETPTFKSVSSVLAHETREAILGDKNTVMYVGTNEAPLYMKPTQEFDTCLGSLSYGDMVMVLEQRGRWARVIFKELSGWILREDLVDRAAYVYPEFILGEENDVDDPNTIRVRAFSGDVFGGGKVAFPLQAGEYVLYRLRRKGQSIMWPEIRPRVPGMWHTILKGVDGIRMSMVPKAGSVMEYVFKDEVGHLAYVEAVFPDETVHVSEVNYPDRGIYNERMITKEEWRELHPVFIEVV